MIKSEFETFKSSKYLEHADKIRVVIFNESKGYKEYLWVCEVNIDRLAWVRKQTRKELAKLEAEYV